MAPPISMLRFPCHTQSPVSYRQTELFTHQEVTKPFECPYCGRAFYSFGGQSRHIAQTECQFLQRTELAIGAAKRSFRLNLDLSSSEGPAAKRVRFKDGDITLGVGSSTTSPTPGTEVSAEHRTPVETEQLTSPVNPPPASDPPIECEPSMGMSDPSVEFSGAGPTPRLLSGNNLVTYDGGKTYVEPFINPLAGSPINDSIAPPFNLPAYIQSTGSLSNLEHFNDLELLMTVGLTNKGRDRFLKSQAYKGQTPWQNCLAMLKDLDALPHGPKWDMHEIEIRIKSGEVRSEYLFGRNILDIIRSLIGDWSFKNDLRYAPVRVWTSKGRETRVYSEAWTAEWWWRLQTILRDKSTTIVPVIIATDKTQLSIMCGGQQAYPVYITIGNIPKSIRRKVNRRATVLLGYLPVDDFENISNPDERARLKHKLTHDAMAILMEPLKQAAKEGVVMTCADGRQRRVYPIPGATEGDWPEQCSMACADEGGCPICEQVFERRSDYPNLAPYRNPADTLAALHAYLNNEDPGELRALRLKPWWPWWALGSPEGNGRTSAYRHKSTTSELHSGSDPVATPAPFFNFHASIMPDLLHQLYQGMIKTHAVAWTKNVVGLGLVDRCFKAMPSVVGLRHFSRGISKVTQWTGRESKEMAKQLVPIVVGQKDIKPDFVSLIRSIVDFTFRAHQSQMTETDIQRLEKDLASFHMKKDVLVATGIHSSSGQLNRVKKLHMLTHYGFAIREMGTPDGYNTESPEHLHIIYAKRGWRASNKVKPLPQMVKFIQQYEAIRIHRMYINLYYGCQDQEHVESIVVYGEDEDAIPEGIGWHARDQEDWECADEPEEVKDFEVEAEEGNGGEGEGEGEGEADGEADGEQIHIRGAEPTGQHVELNPDWSMSIRPTASHVKGLDIVKAYGASDFEFQTNEWLSASTTSGLLPSLQQVSLQHQFDIWHKFYLHHRPLYFDPDQPPRRDTIHAKPPAAVREGSSRSAGPGTFDTVLFLAHPGEFGIHRYRAGRVRVIFVLPLHLRKSYPHPLVYLELFTPFPKTLANSHCMHMTSHDLHRGTRRTAVVPLVWVVAACHLAPMFGQFRGSFQFEQHDLLSVGQQFFLNHYASHFMFGMVDHWRTIQARMDEAKAAKARAAEEEIMRTKAARAKAMRASLVRAQNRSHTARK